MQSFPVTYFHHLDLIDFQVGGLPAQLPADVLRCGILATFVKKQF